LENNTKTFLSLEIDYLKSITLQPISFTQFYYQIFYNELHQFHTKIQEAWYKWHQILSDVLDELALKLIQIAEGMKLLVDNS
jgi:DNA-binding ferritin-like protein